MLGDTVSLNEINCEVPYSLTEIAFAEFMLQSRLNCLLRHRPRLLALVLRHHQDLHHHLLFILSTHFAAFAPPFASSERPARRLPPPRPPAMPWQYP